MNFVTDSTEGAYLVDGDVGSMFDSILLMEALNSPQGNSMVVQDDQVKETMDWPQRPKAVSRGSWSNNESGTRSRPMPRSRSYSWKSVVSWKPEIQYCLKMHSSCPNVTKGRFCTVSLRPWRCYLEAVINFKMSMGSSNSETHLVPKDEGAGVMDLCFPIWRYDSAASSSDTPSSNFCLYIFLIFISVHY